MKKQTKKRRAPLSLRVSGADAALLAEAAAVARVSRHGLIKRAALGLAQTLLETAPASR